MRLKENRKNRIEFRSYLLGKLVVITVHGSRFCDVSSTSTIFNGIDKMMSHSSPVVSKMYRIICDTTNIIRIGCNV
jgi:hypothetical protein